MPLNENQRQIGYGRFLDKYPHVQAELDAISPQTAEAVGTTVDKLRYVTMWRHLSTEAKSLGKDTYEYIVELATDSKEEAQAIIQENNATHRRAIGL